MTGPVETLSNEILYGMLTESPDLALNLGLQEVAGKRLPEAALPDFSAEGVARRHALVADWAERLAAMPQCVECAEDGLTREVLSYTLNRGFQNRFDGRDGFAHAQHLDPLTQVSGAHIVITDMLTRDHPLHDHHDVQAYLERLSLAPTGLRQATDLLHERRAQGFVAPRVVIERAIGDIQATLTVDPRAHGFYRRLADSAAVRSGDAPSALLHRAAAIVARDLQPAYETLLAELAAHRAVARDSLSAASRPGGEAFYAWRFGGHTTSGLTPEQAHAIGRAELERLHAEFSAQCALRNYPQDLRAAFARAANDDLQPAGVAGRHQVLQHVRDVVARSRDALRPYFDRWPAADVVVEPIPPEGEASRYSTYIPTIKPGHEPAVFWLNVAQCAQQPGGDASILCFHETWPGHHLQIALALESPLPPLRRALLLAAYVEGWAKYAEALPESLGFAPEWNVRLARLRSELYSTATLVLDTGIHLHGWSFATARDFFIAQTGADAGLANMVVMRSAANPGHLCAYKIGLLTMRSLRARFAEQRGVAFRVQDFHSAVLDSGALPLAVLEKVVTARAAA